MKYLDLIYNRKEGNYPKELVKYLVKNYIVPGKLGEKKILDIGAGNELYLKLFFDYGIGTYGVDLNANIKNTTFSKLNIVSCDLETDIIPAPFNHFDYIFCKSTIEHIFNFDNLLFEAHRILKPGGKIIILTPAWEYNYKWFYDDPTHVKPYNRKGLQDAMKLANFKEVKVDYFYHLKYTWKHEWLKLIPMLIRLLPDYWRWKDKEETIHRVWVRFAKEIQLLATAEK